MKYRNIKTGAVIETSSQISGENWVEETDLEETDPEDKKQETVKKKPGRKKAGAN